MTERQWLSETEYLRGMLEFLENGFFEGRIAFRQWQLFNCACARRIWARLDDRRGRHVIETAELYVDGQADREEMAAARTAALGTGAASAVALSDETTDYWFDQAVHTAERVASVVGNGERSVQCEMLRDIFGNPFRPVAVDPAWLAWNHGTVPAIARHVYDDRAFHDLPILADALEDAGCTNADLLDHCRGPGPHVRGCWAVDLLLGKS